MSSNINYVALGASRVKHDLFELLTERNNLPQYAGVLKLDEVDLTVSAIVDPNNGTFRSWQVIAFFRDANKLPFPLQSREVREDRARMNIRQCADYILERAYSTYFNDVGRMSRDYLLAQSQGSNQ